jgi:hypothetical protein
MAKFGQFRAGKNLRVIIPSQKYLRIQLANTGAICNGEPMLEQC